MQDAYFLGGISPQDFFIEIQHVEISRPKQPAVTLYNILVIFFLKLVSLRLKQFCVTNNCDGGHIWSAL